MLRHREIRTVDGDGDPVVVDTGVRTRRSFFVTPAQVVSAIGGVVLLAFGIFAIARAGLSSPLSDPQVQVLGIELVVAGIVILAGSDQLISDLRSERALGWLGIIVGGAVLLSALVVPRR